MRIGFIAEASKRELMQNFCIAYKLLLSKHELYATELTARKIEEASGLRVNHFFSGEMGGIIQMTTQIERNEMDAVIYFYNPGEPIEADKSTQMDSFHEVVRLCDEYCIPVATNLASAEILILGIDQGDLDWRM